MRRWNGITPLIITVTAFLMVTSVPEVADGQNRRGSNGKDRPRVDRQIGSQDNYDRGKNRRGQARRGNGAGKVPPGWCNGRGNPHNTWENCGYRSTGRNNGRYYDNRSRNVRGSSYDRQHADLHSYLDRKYRDLAVRRPRDIEYQVRLRAERAREHDNWHRQAGRRH